MVLSSHGFLGIGPGIVAANPGAPLDVTGSSNFIAVVGIFRNVVTNAFSQVNLGFSYIRDEVGWLKMGPSAAGSMVTASGQADLRLIRSDITFGFAPNPLSSIWVSNAANGNPTFNTVQPLYMGVQKLSLGYTDGGFPVYPTAADKVRVDISGIFRARADRYTMNNVASGAGVEIGYDNNIYFTGFIISADRDGGTFLPLRIQGNPVRTVGALIFEGLPTADPEVVGQVWRDGNDLKVSTG
jgi:hypothetical protein